MKEPQGTLRTKDDRGRAVVMLDPYMLHLLRRHDSIPAEPLAEVAADVGSGLRTLAKILLAVSLVCALPGLAFFATHLICIIRDGAPIFPLPGWLPLANVWVGPFIIWVGARQARSRRIRSVMLRHRRCPHCGYDLRLLMPDAADT